MELRIFKVVVRRYPCVTPLGALVTCRISAVNQGLFFLEDIALFHRSVGPEDTKLKRKYMIEQKSGCMGRHPICGGSNRAAETSPYGAYREVRSEEGTVR
jgi:hypothetical protein